VETKIKKAEILPLVKFYMDRLGLVQLFDKYVPNSHGADIPPSQVLCTMVMNIMVSATPLYRVEDWLHDYLDGIAEQRIDAAKYNDDRLGRGLDLLFDADRWSFMVHLNANAVREHQLVTEEIHNDSTSITFIGAYQGADPKAVNITYGHNKDHRPDCKQIVFGLNTTADGRKSRRLTTGWSGRAMRRRSKRRSVPMGSFHWSTTPLWSRLKCCESTRISLTWRNASTPISPSWKWHPYS